MFFPQIGVSTPKKSEQIQAAKAEPDEVELANVEPAEVEPSKIRLPRTIRTDRRFPFRADQLKSQETLKLISDLGSSDDKVRNEAIIKLSKSKEQSVKEKEAIYALVRALEEKNDKQINEFLCVLKDLIQIPKTNKLIENLGSPDNKVRNEALDKLTEIIQLQIDDSDTVFDKVSRLSVQGDIISRRSSINVLSNLGRTKAIYTLTGILEREENSELIGNSISALECLILTRGENDELVINPKIDSHKIELTSKALIKCLQKFKDNENICFNSALLLGHLRKPEAIEILVKYLSNDAEHIPNREMARDSLGKIKQEEALKQMLLILLNEKTTGRTKGYAASAAKQLIQSNLTISPETNALMFDLLFGVRKDETSKKLF